jgi:hypothetical protein
METPDPWMPGPGVNWFMLADLPYRFLLNLQLFLCMAGLRRARSCWQCLQQDEEERQKLAALPEVRGKRLKITLSWSYQPLDWFLCYFRPLGIILVFKPLYELQREMDRRLFYMLK